MKEQQTAQLDRHAHIIGLHTCLATLKPLARSGAYLKRLNRTHWKLHGGAEDLAPGHVKVPVSVIIALKAAGFLFVTSSGQGQLSGAGRSWLNRQLGSGDPFVRQHQSRRLRTVLDEQGAPLDVLVNLCESPLMRLRSRKDAGGQSLLSDEEFEAGERLRRDFTLARLGPQVTATWSGGGQTTRRRRKDGARTNHEQDYSDTVYAARARVASALDAVGPEFENILMDTCCFLIGLEDSEENYGWPRRSAKVVLKLALSALARHYCGRVQAPDRRLKAWAREGYRPVHRRPNTARRPSDGAPGAS